MGDLIPAAMPVYCEREVFGYEVANTLTNASFWVAAWAAWRRGSPSGFHRGLIALCCVIGLCSGLFHAFRTAPLLVLDAAPLYLFVAALAYRSIARISRPVWGIAFAVGTVVLALVANKLTAGTALNVASRHGAALVAFAGAGVAIARADGCAGRWTFFAVAFYAVALVSKTLDATVCAFFPFGTHWGWHLLGGAAAYAGLRALAALESHGGAPPTR